MLEETRKLTVTGEGKTYYVTIPLAIIKKLKWRKGEKKVVSLKNDTIVISDWREHD